MLTQLHVPDLRDGGLTLPGPTTASAPDASPPVPPSPGGASVSVTQADAAGEVAIGLVPEPVSTAPDRPAEPPAAPPSILVRTLSTQPADAVDPTAAFLPWPRSRTGDAHGTP